MILQRGFRSGLEKFFDLSKRLEIEMYVRGNDVYDYCCLGVDKDEKNKDDQYVVFYNQVSSPKQEIVLEECNDKSKFKVSLLELPENIEKLIFTVSIDGPGFLGEMESSYLEISQGEKETLEFALTKNEFQDQKTLIMFEIYRREDTWRAGIVAGSFKMMLADFLKSHGVEVVENTEENDEMEIAQEEESEDLQEDIAGSERQGGNISRKDAMSCSQIISQNPILNENSEKKKLYYCYLVRCINKGRWKKRKYVKAQLEVYKKFLLNKEERNRINIINTIIDLGEYKYFVIFDLLSILGYDVKTIKSQRMTDTLETLYQELCMTDLDKKFISIVFAAANGNNVAWKKLKEHFILKKYQKYLDMMKLNLDFVYEEPYRMLVTATMSAGKSTFINALTGKYICLSQNMACTSKIHSISSKAFEDNCICDYDYELSMDADRNDVLENNEKNVSDNIFVSTYFNGELGGKRIVINDSPGVNFSENSGHKMVTEKMVKAKKYNLLIYLLNATQLGTNDDEVHLEFVRQQIGRRPIVFILNKIDAFHKEDDNVENATEKHRQYLEGMGFKSPIVCPISSKVAYLAKKSQKVELSRIERREMDFAITDFEEIDLKKYYEEHYPEIVVEDSQKEEEQLLKNCGISYVEKIFKVLCEGGKINGTDFC